MTRGRRRRLHAPGATTYSRAMCNGVCKDKTTIDYCFANVVTHKLRITECILYFGWKEDCVYVHVQQGTGPGIPAKRVTRSLSSLSVPVPPTLSPPLLSSPLLLSSSPKISPSTPFFFHPDFPTLESIPGKSEKISSSTLIKVE